MKHERNEHVADAYDTWLDGHNHNRIERLTGYDRSTLYDWRSGRYPLPTYALAPTYMAVPSLAALSQAIGLPDLGLLLSRRPSAGAASDVRDAALRLTQDVGDLAGIIARAKEGDGHIDDGEREEIRLAAEKVQQLAEELIQLSRGGR